MNEEAELNVPGARVESKATKGRCWIYAFRNRRCSSGVGYLDALRAWGLSGS